MQQFLILQFTFDPQAMQQFMILQFTFDPSNNAAVLDNSLLLTPQAMQQFLILQCVFWRHHDKTNKFKTN